MVRERERDMGEEGGREGEREREAGERGEEGRWKKRGDGGRESEREREEGRDRSERLTSFLSRQLTYKTNCSSSRYLSCPVFTGPSQITKITKGSEVIPLSFYLLFDLLHVYSL